MDIERWKPVAGFGQYEVSSFGRLRKNGKIKKLNKTGNGYLAVSLYKEGKQKKFLVHRLVLSHFVGVCPSGMECLHRDGDKRNNKVGNLRWGTHKQNCQDRIAHGTQCHLKGSKNGLSKLTESQIQEIRKFRQEGKTQSWLAMTYKISQSVISMILSRKIWTHV